MRSLHLVHVMLYALVAGVFWGTWFSLSRSIESISPSTFLEVGHTMIRNLGRPMSLLMPAAVLSNVAVVVLLFRQSQRQGFLLSAAALLMLVLALIVTLTVNVPIDNQIQEWTAATLPAGWQSARDRWQFFHSLRTFASLIGLGCAFASSLWNRPTP